MKAWRVIEHLVVLGVLAASSVAVAAKDKAPTEKARTAASEKRASSDAKADPPAKPTQTAETAEAEEDAASDPLATFLATVPHVVGPQRVLLGHHAQLDLPTGMNLLEQAQAQDLMRKIGNGTERVIAVVMPPVGSGSTWMIVIGASDVGYVNDDDADELDATSMLEQFKQGTLEQNKKRVAMGVSELFIDGWSERPRYEPATHHLVWGLNAHDSESKVVNFFTRFLGRLGFLSVNLIDDPATIEASKAQALSVLTALQFEMGSRYQDHASSDEDSGIGLKALVLGGTGVVIAKKTGLLVAIAIFLKKGFVVVLVAIGGFFRWLFRRKRDGEHSPRDPDPPGIS
jgi:uncharacterized membrane-anchored protein